MKYEYKKAPAVQEYSVIQGAAVTTGDKKIIAKDIPCQEACPAKTNVPLYIEHLLHGDPLASYLVNLEDNVFPGVLGRVCYHPCEQACQRAKYDQPVGICRLKRFLADKELDLPEKDHPKPPKRRRRTNKKVAVIGSGPAGITAAYQLVLQGHDITVFEALAEPGGFLRTFVREGPPMARLLYEAVKRGIAPDYARRLLAAFPVALAEQAAPPETRISNAALVEPLSERELEVLQLIAEGLTNREIASRLYLALNTVKAHTRNIYGKLGVHNRTQAVARARALGILPAV